MMRIIKQHHMIHYIFQFDLLQGQELRRLKETQWVNSRYLSFIFFKTCKFNLFSYLHVNWASYPNVQFYVNAHNF